MIGHLDVVPGSGAVTPARDRDLAHRHDAAGGAEPSHHGFVPDAHVHDVVAAERHLVTPVQRAVGIEGPHQGDSGEIVAFGDELCAHQNVNFALPEISKHFAEVTATACSVEIAKCHKARR